MPNIKQTLATLKWLLPTRFELIGYSIVGLLTAAVSNFKVIGQFLLLPGDFSLWQAILDAIDTVLSQLLGDRVTDTLVLGIFWGLVGLIIYMSLWLLSNFSSQLSAGLAVRNYVHPQGADPNYALKILAARSLFRLAGSIVFVFYVTILVQVLLPLWTEAFQSLTRDWPQPAAICQALLMLAVEICALHAITILLRLTLLRRRVLGNYPS